MIARVLAVVLLALPAWAHDFWIEPSTFRPAAGEAVSLQLRVGEHFEGEPVAIHPARIERFLARSASGERAIDRGGTVVFDGNDVVVGYRSKPSYVELPAETFERYLREEGLDSIIALRAERGDSSRPAREIFSRCAKTLLGGRDRQLGLRLEIVRRSRGELAVTFDGKPLTNALVVAMRRGAAHTPFRARTDTEGRVSFPPLGSGVWLVKTVHMIPAVTADADWESIWASTTFEVP